MSLPLIAYRPSLCVSCRRPAAGTKCLPAKLDGYRDQRGGRVICWACEKWAEAQMPSEKARA